MAAILSQIRSATEDAFPAKPTPEQLKESAPMREAQRKRISDILNHASDNEQFYKKFDGGINFWNRLKSYLKDELAWWNANVELTPEAVMKRGQQEKEKLEAFEKEWDSIVQKGSAKTQEEKAVKQKQIEETLNRGWADDLSDAVKVALGYATGIAWILLGIRLGGLLANDLLYKPVAYRALAFIYSFFFLPFLLPYWAYREIKYLIYGKADLDAPHFESIFPVVPYDPASPLSLEKRLYGYPDSPALSGWIAKKRQEEENSWLNAISVGLLQRLFKEREDSQKA